MAAPKGNRNAKKAKDWERALRGALHRYEAEGIKPGQALDRIAEKVVAAALVGDWDAIEEISNRLDGKAAQHIEGEITHRHTAELTDDELIAIASGSSAGVADEAPGETDASSLH